MTIKIFAGGCRSITDTGQVEDRYCNECPEQNVCDLEPRAPELARIFSDEWVKMQDRLPSKTSSVLYLENSDEKPSGILHYGYYNWRQKRFIEQGSEEATPQDVVIAWMRIPEVPAGIHEELRRKQAHAYMD